MEVSVRHSRPGRLSRKKEVQEHCLTIEDWTDHFSRNVGNYQSSQKIEDIIYNNLLMPIMLSKLILFLKTIHLLYIHISLCPSVHHALYL